MCEQSNFWALLIGMAAGAGVIMVASLVAVGRVRTPKPGEYRCLECGAPYPSGDYCSTECERAALERWAA